MRQRRGRGRWLRLGAVAGCLLLGACGTAGGDLALGDAVEPAAQSGAIPGCDAAEISDCLDSQDDMRLLFDYTQQQVQSFAAEQVPQFPDTTNWMYVAAGESGDEGCVDYNGDPAQYTDMSYEYCPPDEAIYVGEALMWTFFQDHGDAGPSIGIAHEWGHSIQHAAGVYDLVGSREDYINTENQADCIAGSWYRSQIKAGVASRSDVVDVATMMAAVSDAESPERTHGTLKERETAFFLGVAYGLERCNEYFPDAPIYTGTEDTTTE